MSMREDIMAVKHELEEVKVEKQESLAMELLKDQRRQNKRLFAMWLVTFLVLIGVACYTIYLVNDIGVTETTITQENEDGYNNYIGNDGDITSGETND